MQKAAVAVVEFQAFQDNDGKFIVKELAIVSERFQSFTLFSAPYNFSVLNDKAQRSARWLQSHYHCIRWDECGIPYNVDTIRTLCTPFAILFTKGLEKALFLRQFHPCVMELPREEKFSGYDLKCLLPQHNINVNSKCALKNAKCYYDSLFA